MLSWDRQPFLCTEDKSSVHVVCPDDDIFLASSLSKHLHQFPCFFMEVDTMSSHFIEKNVAKIKNANETS